MTIWLVVLSVFVVYLWFMLGHWLRLMTAAWARGGCQVSRADYFFCYVCAPITAFKWAFEGLWKRSR